MCCHSVHIACLQVRMTADSKLPLDQRRNYTNVFNAMVRIFVL